MEKERNHEIPREGHKKQKRDVSLLSRGNLCNLVVKKRR